jgi:hypothetical protein
MVDVDFDLTGIESFQAEIEDTAAEWEGGRGYRVFSNVEYAVYQEYGTRYQSGTPHVRPGADKTRAQLGRLAVSADSLDEFLRKAALTLEGEIKQAAPVDTGTLRSSYQTERI